MVGDVVLEDKFLKLSDEELRSLQLKSLEILLYFKKFFEEHNLMFYFCGGCCIGVLRHQGFIPWDDDIDIFMPRNDYEKLFKIWNKYADTEKYSCNRTTKDVFIGNVMTTITDNHTKVIRPWQKGVILIAGAGILILIMTVMFLFYIDFGSKVISGVNGRYLLPWLVCLPLLLKNNVFVIKKDITCHALTGMVFLNIIVMLFIFGDLLRW